MKLSQCMMEFATSHIFHCDKLYGLPLHSVLCCTLLALHQGSFTHHVPRASLVITRFKSSTYLVKACRSMPVLETLCKKDLAHLSIMILATIEVSLKPIGAPLVCLYISPSNEYMWCMKTVSDSNHHRLGKYQSYMVVTQSAGVGWSPLGLRRWLGGLHPTSLILFTVSGVSCAAREGQVGSEEPNLWVLQQPRTSMSSLTFSGCQYSFPSVSLFLGAFH